MISDVNTCYDKMNEMELIAKQATDILECRIEAVLEQMSLTPLTDIPEDEAITIEEAMKITEEVCEEAAVTLTK